MGWRYGLAELCTTSIRSDAGAAGDSGFLRRATAFAQIDDIIGPHEHLVGINRALHWHDFRRAAGLAFFISTEERRAARRVIILDGRPAPQPLTLRATV
jgi:hypothetical protein